MDQYGVVGNPVAHSKSPRIHAWFAGQCGQAMEYRAILVEPGDFPRAVKDFFASGGKGLNVTVPFKEEAWKLPAVQSEHARLAGAVNTLFIGSGRVLNAHNTDGIGLVRDILRNHGGILRGKRLLVLGAGGAARGILKPLLDQEPAVLRIANRTVDKANALAQAFGGYGKLESCGFEALAGQRFDWVINATSASLQGELPPLPENLLAPGAWCYDLMYADAETPFRRWAREMGAERSMDGLGMLVEQAAESFYLWRGTRPKTAEVIARLRP